MFKKLGWLALFTVMMLPVQAFAESTASQAVIGYLSTSCGSAAPPCFIQYSPTNPVVVTGSSGGTPVPVTPTGTTGTDQAGTVITHLTFQTLFTASATRKGCNISNNGSDTLLVFRGATGSATRGAGEPVLPNGSWSCDDGLTLEQANIAITSNTTDGATFAYASW